MNKWLIALLLGFSGGVLIRSFSNFGWSFAVLCIFLSLLLVVFFCLLKFQKFVLFASLFFLTFGLGILRYEIKDRRNFEMEKLADSKITINALVVDEPDEKENYRRLTIEEEKTKNKISVLSRRYPVFRYGDNLEISSILQKPKKVLESDTFGREFDWPAYLAKDDIYYEMFYPEIKLLSSRGGFWLKRWLFAVKEKYILNLSSIVSEPYAGFLAGLTVGAKQAMPKSLLEDFRKVGVIHIVVLSGYNITLVADTVMKIFRGLPNFTGISLGILGILLFTLMTGASSTAVRASIMACLVLLARATGRIYQITIVLLITGFLMVLDNPKILRFDSSFQLSFLATLALIYFAPLIEKKLGFIPKKSKLREIVSATVATQIFVLPFLLYKMGLFSAVSLPVNLLVLILVPATMFFSFIAGGFGFLSQFLSIPFGWIAYGLSAYELWIVDVFSKLPFASFNISIPFWLMLLVYGGYAIVLLKMDKNKDSVSLD